MSNLPLFILAAPMLSILVCSCIWACHGIWHKPEREESRATITSTQGHFEAYKSVIDEAFVIRMTLPQITLAVLALSTYHVQIVTRISSGYPLWYWWLASLILEDRRWLIVGREFKTAGLVTKWMISYAVIQGGLFASFLPPA